MLPLQQAYEVKESILEYIKATFTMKDRDVNEAFFRFICDPQHGIFKGPYISVRAPYKSDPDADIPLEIKPSFAPFHHQAEAFKKLTTQNDHQPENTILTTGTGSGKTECFTFPILDYCYQNKSARGIKVIILYPMNALATDQAKRLAELIWNDDRLKGKITAGLYIGKGENARGHSFATEMGEHNVIEKQDVIENTPPDILMTNFKMLDMALMLGERDHLWHFNRQNNELLRFLVLDELHTYDGAQGTDVANLLRRLKLKLNIPQGYLCGIGTSATIGDGENSKEKLCEYASDVFGETFTTESIIGETRMPVDELFTGDAINFVPSLRRIRESQMLNNEDYNDYIERLKEIWQCSCSSPIELAGNVARLQISRDLVRITDREKIEDLDAIIRKLVNINSAFANLPETDEETGINPRQEAIASLLALVASAKRNTGKPMPYLAVQVQLWVRELSGIRRIVAEEPRFTWNNEITRNTANEVALPMFYCRDCGASGWLGLYNERDESFSRDSNSSAVEFMNDNRNVFMLNTTDGTLNLHRPVGNYNDEEVQSYFLGVSSLQVLDHHEESSIRVWAFRRLMAERGGNTRSSKCCPECESQGDSVCMVGMQTASISSLSISQVLTSDLDETPESGRKLLAFTNSVQDAAHDASFFEARNYRFNFRTAIQEVINHHSGEMTLTELYSEFCSYWKNKLQSADENKPFENYLYRFLPSDLEGRVNLEKDGQDLSGHYTDDFINEFDFRMSWEICSEFGLNANLGRTLEKTGCSSAYFHNDDIAETANRLTNWLNENNLQNIYEQNDGTDLKQFILGLLYRIRLHGGVDHPTLEGFRHIQSQGELNWYNGHHWLFKYFSRKARLPKLVVCNPIRPNSINETTFKTRAQNWFHSYFYQCFNLVDSDDTSRINDFYTILFNTMAETGLLISINGNEGVNYAINPDKIYIAKNAVHYQCSSCQKYFSAHPKDGLAQGIHCINYRCNGTYTTELPNELNYYHNVYNRQKAIRIYANEHTGLLERKVREALENDFINHPRPNSCNTLVATSTLEMGIDIGDLNTTMNTAVPPRPSNFLQRIGRAGRKTGTALILNYSRRKKHDLYYFTDPKEMMKGEVGTPGCFLTAKDILQRHFLAFCIDSWATEDALNNVIPVRLVLLGIQRPNFSASDTSFFVSRLINFISRQLDQLCASFSQQYSRDVVEIVLPELFEAYRNGSMYEPLRNVFMKKHEEFMYLQETENEIRQHIQSLAENDNERKELKNHLRFISAQKEAIKDTNTLEFLTDQGLLPNYAFPESGVKLVANIEKSHTNQQGETEWDEPEVIELMRPASSALTELAPSNHFYIQGYKLDIDGLNTFDWTQSKTSAKKRKRYCSNCDFIMDDVNGNVSPCPKCGDTSITSSDNTHTFVYFTGAKSYMQRKHAIADDSDEERKTESFRTTLHFDFTQKAVSLGAWGLKNAPFGIEFCKNVTLTNVNLGRNEEHSANNTTINGFNNIPRAGFVTCNICGKTTARPSCLNSTDQQKRLRELHYPFCNKRNQDYTGQEDENFTEVFLYRELMTEVIKILLPIDQFETEAHLLMFKAGIELGLKKFYEGNPEHIHLTNYKEFNKNTNRFDQYIVLYDTIPGGSGYLAQLNDPLAFTRLLELAYTSIKNCSCQWEGKDGCYKCILSYGNQRNQDLLSRERAEELFRRLYDFARKDGFRKLENNTLGSLSETGGQEESELEEWFIESVKRRATAKGWNFASDVVNGERNYRLTIHTSSQNRVYKIYPQRWLGESDNVALSTRPDFLFRCVNYQTKNATSTSENMSDDVPSIAVFTDGYRYHGAFYNGKFRYKDDLLRREAIRNSGHIIPWTLTWEDLRFFESPDRDSFNNEDGVQVVESLSVERFHHEMVENINDQFGTCCLNDKVNNMERLFFLIENNQIEATDTGMVHCLSKSIGQFLLQWNNDLDPHSLTDLGAYLSNKNGPFTKSVDPTDDEIEDGKVFLPTTLNQDNEWFHLNIAVKLNDLSTSYTIDIPESTNDCDANLWNRFWRTYNLLAICPNNADNLYLEADGNDDSGTSIDIELLLEEFDDSLHETIRKMVANNIDFFHGEYSLMDEAEEVVIAQALLLVNSPKIAVIGDEDSQKAFEDAGYKVISIDNISNLETEIGI